MEKEATQRHAQRALEDRESSNRLLLCFNLFLVLKKYDAIFLKNNHFYGACEQSNDSAIIFIIIESAGSRKKVKYCKEYTQETHSK